MIRDKTFTFIWISSPVQLGWKMVRGRNRQSTAYKWMKLDNCMKATFTILQIIFKTDLDESKIKEMSRNLHPPSSPRLLQPGFHPPLPPCWLAGWLWAGETSIPSWKTKVTTFLKTVHLEKFQPYVSKGKLLALEDAKSNSLHSFDFSLLWFSTCSFKRPSQTDLKSHRLHWFDFSPLHIFIWAFKLPAWENA